MNVLYVCRAVDENAKWTAAQVQWITTLANSPGVHHVHVLTTKAGNAALPDNVTVRQLWRGSRAKLVLSFLWEVMRARPFRQDFFFVVQGGPFPALLLPFKVLTGSPIYQWKAQPHVSRAMRFYARCCDDLVFTATEQSLLIPLPNKRVVGHGIDTELFRPRSGIKDRDLITVGRISPIKRIEKMIEAVAACRQGFGVTPGLDIVGRLDGPSQAYASRLRALVDELDLGASVRFLGHIDYRELPRLLSRYRAGLNFSLTAFDKSVGEAMACGVPVITTNACVIESLPPELHSHLVVDQDDVDGQGLALHRAVSWSDATGGWLQKRVRDYILEKHNLDSFFRTVLDEIRAHKRVATSALPDREVPSTAVLSSRLIDRP